MKFSDEGTRDALAKSSTILQCILAILDFECNKSHIQPECIGVENNEAMVSVEDMNIETMLEVCDRVNRQFQRKDGVYSCIVENEVDSFISCVATSLDKYVQLN